MRDVETLLEALPYIRDFHGRTVVIKYGGAAMTDPVLREEFARDVVLLKYVGLNPIVVHGGGPAITGYMERLGMEVEFVDGLRVSDAATVEVAKMVLVGKQNKDIVLLLGRHGQPAVGLCGDDGMLFQVRKQVRADERDIGFVGEIERVNVGVLNHIAEDYIPVIASVGADAGGPVLQRERRRRRSRRGSRAGRLQGHLPDRRDRLAVRPRRPRVAHLAEHRRRGQGRSARRIGRYAAQARGVRRSAGGRRAQRVHHRRPAPARAAAGAVHRRGHRNQAVALTALQELEARAVVGTYARNPVEFVRGQGSVLWDADGHEYLDFLAGISVVQIGHCHPALVEAVTEQAARLMHVGNLYYTEPSMRLAGRLSELGLGGKAFFCNSGTEAIECAIKLARRHRPQGEFVVMEGGFHGRTMGALSATPQEAKQAPFAPLVPGFTVVPHDDAEAVAAAVDGQHRGGPARAGPGRGRHPPALGRHAGGGARGVRRARRDAHLRRDPVRHGPHRRLVGLAARRRAPRRDDRGQGPGRRAADRRLPDRARVRRRAPARRPRLHVRRRPRDRGRRQRGARRDRGRTGSWTRWPPRAPGWPAACGDLGLDVRGRGLMLAFAAEDAPALARRLLLDQRLVVNATGPDTIRLLPPLTVSEDEIDEAAARIGAAL